MNFVFGTDIILGYFDQAKICRKAEAYNFRGELAGVFALADVSVRSPQKMFICIIANHTYRVKVCLGKKMETKSLGLTMCQRTIIH